MSKEFVKTIRKLRERAGLSQQDVAEAVGIARATYVKLENGGREPKQSEILALSRYYEVSPLTIMTGEEMVEEPPAIYDRSRSEKLEPAIQKKSDNTQPKADREKLREIILYITAAIGAKPTFNESVLHKLLYLIDESSVCTRGKPIIGLSYAQSYYGPQPDGSLQKLITHMEKSGEIEIITTRHFKNTQRKIFPIRLSRLDDISTQDIMLVDAVLFRYADKTAGDLSVLTKQPRLSVQTYEPST